MARECQLKNGGGQIMVQLSVTNGIISGGDFSIYDFDSGIISLSFKMHTDTSGKAIHHIQPAASALIGKVLSWHILSCSPIITNTCIVEVKIFQDEKECVMNIAAHYALANVPNCSISHALPVKGGLHFVNRLTESV